MAKIIALARKYRESGLTAPVNQFTMLYGVGGAYAIQDAYA